MENHRLSVCIIGEEKEGNLQECIQSAMELSKDVFYIDRDYMDGGLEKAVRLGAKGIKSSRSREDTVEKLRENVSSEWILFIKPDERLKVISRNKLKSALDNKDADAYAFMTKSGLNGDELEPFQLMKKLEQFRDVRQSIYAPEYQIRLFRKSHIPGGLDLVMDSRTDKIVTIKNHISEDLLIESMPRGGEEGPSSGEERDLRCLRGEISFDPDHEEDLFVLSEIFTGFRVLHKGYLDAFIDGAQRGFGTYKMYIPMLGFLCDQGYLQEARLLFETWIRNRKEDEVPFTYKMGGHIYSNLLEFERAIEYFEKSIGAREDMAIFVSLGKLYLLNGERQRAIEWFQNMDNFVGDAYIKRWILPTIKDPDWRPMTVSLCMIARDEEASIPKAFESVQKIADEIIVVDTGSTDRTKEIVKRYGGRIIDMEWRDDFSAARNRALQEATGDYILCMDADEYIDSRHRFQLALLKRLLPLKKDTAFRTKVELPRRERKLSVQAYLDILQEYEMAEYQTRFFPRHEEIRFEGFAFEDVDRSIRKLGIQSTPNDMLRITHAAENRIYREQRKTAAVSRLLESVVVPNKLTEGGLFFLRLGDLKKAHPWFTKMEVIKPELAAKLAVLYARQNEPELGKVLVTQGLKQSPRSPDLILALAEMYYREESYQEIRTLLEDKITSIDRDLDPQDLAAALFYHGMALLETGQIVSGIDQIAKARDLMPNDSRYKVAGFYAFAKVDQWEDALLGASRIAEEEGIEIASVVNDFVDAGKIFIDLYRSYRLGGRMDEADLCHRIIGEIFKTKISKKEDMEQMSNMVECVIAAA